MKKQFLNRVIQTSWLAFVIFSCQQETPSQLTTAQEQVQVQATAADNSQIVATSQDVMDVTGSAMPSQGIVAGRAASYNGTTNLDLDCAPIISSSITIDKSHLDSIIYSGSLTLDYGTGVYCKDSTEIRKGKITDSFVLLISTKNSLSFNLKETITFQGYQKDTISVDGTFISTSSSSDSSTLTIQNAKITYADGTFVTWSGTLTNSYLHKQNTPVSIGGFRELTGSINGINRKGVSFTTKITNGILFDYSCSRDFPVEGTVDITVGNVLSVLDYGTGTCDKDYTISSNGKVTTYTFKRHHHV